MPSTNPARPKKLPGRMWGSHLYRQVQYRQGELAQIGYLARWRNKGRVPLDLLAKLTCLYPAFDHVEYWLGYADDLTSRDLDRRILVGHPYRFDEPTRRSLEAAAQEFGLVWWATPPKKPNPGQEGAAPGVITSWYSDSTWLVVVQPKDRFAGAPAPEECAIRYGRKSERRPLEPGETLQERPPRPSVIKKRKTRRSLQPPRISIADAIDNPAESTARLLKWRRLQENKRRLAELEASVDIDRELDETEQLLAAVVNRKPPDPSESS